jgi:uncharacterized protein YbjT (DUF2867 family)
MSKVYVLGGTGGVGTQVVKVLLSRGIQTTILARDPTKAAGLFGESEYLTVVKGDYSDMESFKQSIVGHERLFLMVTDMINMPALKLNYAQIAYSAGVKQVVHLSSGSVCGPRRRNLIATVHYDSEEAIYSIPNRGFYVTLRPNSFFSNHLWGADYNSIKNQSALFGSSGPNAKRSWVSPTDIADLAANVLTEPIEKHADTVYHMTTELLSGPERAQIFSRVLGKEIKYVQVSVEEDYKAFTEKSHMPHSMVYGFLNADHSGLGIDTALSIVLHRPPQSLEAWVELNKDKFL